jgi:hypothetical protein
LFSNFNIRLRFYQEKQTLISLSFALCESSFNFIFRQISSFNLLMIIAWFSLYCCWRSVGSILIHALRLTFYFLHHLLVEESWFNWMMLLSSSSEELRILLLLEMGVTFWLSFQVQHFDVINLVTEFLVSILGLVCWRLYRPNWRQSLMECFETEQLREDQV